MKFRIGSDEDDEGEDEVASADDPSETAVSRDAEKERSSSDSTSSESTSQVEEPEPKNLAAIDDDDEALTDRIPKDDNAGSVDVPVHYRGLCRNSFCE